MSTWMNNDGLFVKFGGAEGDVSKGGHLIAEGNRHVVEFDIDAADIMSATPAIVGSAVAGTDGARGVIVPKGARIEAVETLVVTAFTNGGTIGTATLVLGFKKASDRSTELDHDGLLTTAFVGSKLDAAGERNYQEVGTTGSGDDIGTTLAEAGVVVASNSQHGSHPYLTGKLRVRIFYFFP